MGGFHSVSGKEAIIDILISLRNALFGKHTKKEKIINLYGIHPSFEDFLDKRMGKNYDENK